MAQFVIEYVVGFGQRSVDEGNKEFTLEETVEAESLEMAVEQAKHKIAQPVLCFADHSGWRSDSLVVLRGDGIKFCRVYPQEF